MRTEYEIEEKLNDLNGLLGQSLGFAREYNIAKEALKHGTDDEQMLARGAYTIGQEKILEWILADKEKINKHLKEIEGVLQSLKSAIENY